MGNGDTKIGKIFYYSYENSGEYLVSVRLKDYKTKQFNPIIKIHILEPKLKIENINFDKKFYKNKKLFTLYFKYCQKNKTKEEDSYKIT